MRLLVAGFLATSLAMAMSQPQPIAAATTCERLSSVVLPDATIKSAETVEAGKFERPGDRGAIATFAVLPAFCRVTAVLTPSSDSHIEMEVWLPLDKWNGKFQAVGNGGWAGVISFEAGWRMPQPGGELPTVALDSFRYLGHQDTNWNGMNFDLDQDLALVLQTAGFIDAINPDLAKFKARGGKLLIYHGWADPGPAPANTINCFFAVNKRGRQDRRLDEAVPLTGCCALRRRRGTGQSRLCDGARTVA
jgi:Tannase and feruloyl esterase